MTKLLDKIGSKVWSKIQFATTVQIGFGTVFLAFVLLGLLLT